MCVHDLQGLVGVEKVAVSLFEGPFHRAAATSNNEEDYFFALGHGALKSGDFYVELGHAMLVIEI